MSGSLLAKVAAFAAAFLLQTNVWSVSLSEAADSNYGQTENSSRQEEGRGVTPTLDRPSGMPREEEVNALKTKERSPGVLTKLSAASAGLFLKQRGSRKWKVLFATLIAGLMFVLSRLGGALWRCLAVLTGSRPGSGPTPRSLSEQFRPGEECEPITTGFDKTGTRGVERPRRRVDVHARGKAVTGALLSIAVVLVVAIALGVHTNKHTGSEHAGTHTDLDYAATRPDSQHAKTPAGSGHAGTPAGWEHAGTPAGSEDAGARPHKGEQTEAGGDAEGEDRWDLVDSVPRVRVEDGGKVVHIGERWKDGGGKRAARSGMKIQFDYAGRKYILHVTQTTETFLQKEGTLAEVVGLLSNPPRMMEKSLYWGPAGDGEFFLSSETKGQLYEVYLPKGAFNQTSATDLSELSKAKSDLEILAMGIMDQLLTEKL